MTSKYICIDCELANSEAEPVDLNQHGFCSRCGSSSVVPVDQITELMTKQKASEARERAPTPDTQERHKAMLALRAAGNEGMRAYLNSLHFDLTPTSGVCESLRVNEVNLSLNDKLTNALNAWDGWGYFVHYPWQVRPDDYENPRPGHWCIELINGVKGSSSIYITLDEYVENVESFQLGTK